MARLGVNIDHVATVRQARRTVEPDPVWAAVEAELGGAACITFHLRKDRRHIQDRDARLLRETVRVKLNMEMSLDEEIVDLAADLGPDQVTLVPENRREVTTEGGLDARGVFQRLKTATARFNEQGVTVSVFIDPETDQIDAAREAGAAAVELHTGRYANACLLPAGPERVETIRDTLGQLAHGLEHARGSGLVVHAGHGLTYNNVDPVAAMRGFSEFNIGHSLISRALFVGIRQATREMVARLRNPAVS